MKNNAYPFYYIIVGLLSLALCLLVGLLSGVQYAIPDFINESLPFTVLRPLHTLFALSWIFMAAIGGIFWYINNDKINPVIAFSYLSRNFGGKEYLEFPHWFYIPILVGWLFFGIYYFRVMWQTFSKWPVYYWMWGTGIVLMIFHFTEAHLWHVIYFSGNYIEKLTMQ